MIYNLNLNLIERKSESHSRKLTFVDGQHTPFESATQPFGRTYMGDQPIRRWAHIIVSILHLVYLIEDGSRIQDVSFHPEVLICVSTKFEIHLSPLSHPITIHKQKNMIVSSRTSPRLDPPPNIIITQLPAI